MGKMYFIGILAITLSVVQNINHEENQQFILQPFQTFCYYQYITSNVHHQYTFTLQNDKTEIAIYDTNKKIIFSRKNKKQYVYATSDAVASKKKSKSDDDFQNCKVCISNLINKDNILTINEKVGIAAGDRQVLLSKDSKIPLEQSVVRLEQQVQNVINLVTMDDQIVKKYQNHKQSINQVSYLYGAMTVGSILIIAFIQVHYLKNMLVKKKLI